jgi:hypothetical protein
MAKSAAGRFISRKKKINFTLPNSKSKITINPDPIMKNTIMPIAFYAALNAKRQTLTKRVARYTEYVNKDKALVAKSENHAHKYGNRLRNHEVKLERFKQNLASVEATLANP